MESRFPKISTLFAVAFASLLSTGCSEPAGHADLERYVSEVKARKGGRIEPMPEFKTYETFAYSAFDKRSPFTPTVGRDRDIEVADNGLRPDTDRHKEPLEQFPLDTLRFGGHLEKDGQRWGIVTAPDGLVHRVQIGNHLGQNYGRIVGITETRIELVEIVPNGIGGWVERQAALTLNTEE